MPERTIEGSWSLPSLAGGCPKHGSWPQNPQYRLVPKGTEAQSCEIKLSCGARQLRLSLSLSLILSLRLRLRLSLSLSLSHA